jgi:hypothetical protein
MLLGTSTQRTKKEIAMKIKSHVRGGSRDCSKPIYV